MDFLEISPHELECSNAFNMIGKEWFLICAADAERECGANAMTASWGYLGNMWNKPSAVYPEANISGGAVYKTSVSARSA